MEANQKATELLLKRPDRRGPARLGRRPRPDHPLHRLGHPERNKFTVVNQYRVDCPPGYNRGKAFIVPDLVLLVNGIPLVVVECKSPSMPEPLAEAVDQLRRYSNQRRASRRGGRQRGQRAAVPHQPVAGRHQLRRGARGQRGRGLPALRGLEDGGGPRRPGHRGRGGAGAGQGQALRAGAPGRRPAAPGAPAGRGAALHAVHGGRRPDREVGLPLPAVPRRQPRHRTACAPARPGARTASTTSAAASSGTPRARARA